jgi:NhaA family Na+:H+ antiporter
MTRQPPPIDRILAPLRAFTDGSASGGVLLIIATVVALVWVNSPWAAGYDRLWHTELGVSVGQVSFVRDLHFWVNDALMALFFLVIGLEIKREVLVGELDSVRRAILPVVAAVGGALVPALVYVLLVGLGSPATRGWGVPMATDIAFALGVLALMGRWAPLGLRIFLTALAIVDDLLAVVVIAVFYSEGLNVTALAATGGVLVFLVGMNALGVRRLAAYMIPGVVLWFAVYQTGIHPTIAGVLLALTIPARTRLDGPSYVQRAGAQLREVAARIRNETGIEERHAALWELEDITQGAQAPMLRLEHGLHPWVAFVIVPLFALANAGIRFPEDVGAALSQPVVIGVVVGLVLGKQLGISAAAWLAVRSGFASLPAGVAWRHMYGAAWLGGIGFTMSLFVAELAFPDPALEDAAKLGILLASVIAGLGGFVVLFLADRRGSAPELGAA